MSEIEWADMTSEIERLRERVAELERETGYSDQRLVDIYDRATKAEAERDAALAQVAVLREALEELVEAVVRLDSRVAQKLRRELARSRTLLGDRS